VKVVLFGATGMIGSGALIECLDHPDVERVLVVGRRSCGRSHEKLVEVLHDDFLDLSGLVDRFRGYDACIFCLGVSSAGMGEDAYRRITFDMTMAAAEAMLAAAPGSTFVYVSGAGTDSTEKGRVMWARVKGAIENRLAGMPFGAVWLFRPGFIQPRKGVRSATPLYNAIYAVLGPFYPLLRRLPRWVTSTDRLGLALIRAARDGAPSLVVESIDIEALAEAEVGRLGFRTHDR
jgi:uncharacterized protein YbjT (DUF2867 family)